MQQIFPDKKLKKISHKRFTTPWMTPEIIICINKKHRLFIMFKRKEILYSSYSYYCKKLKLLLDISEKSYHKEKLKNTSSSPRKKWNYINSCLGRFKNSKIDELITDDKTITNVLEIANILNEYFTQIPHDIHERIHCSNNTKRQIKSIPFLSNTFFFQPITAFEIEDIVSVLKSNSVNSALPTKFLKLIVPKISNILSDLFNECIQLSTFPKVFKYSLVTPIHKSGSKCEVKNYRPISLITQLSKIFEKAIVKRLYNFFINNNILKNKQFGFIPGKSTTHAIMNVVNQSLPAISNNQFCIIIFLDFTKAFDCVSHEILINKLYRYGLRGSVSDFFKSYLSGRTIAPDSIFVQATGPNVQFGFFCLYPYSLYSFYGK